MPTADELARDLLASVDTDAGAPLALRWLNNRYKEMMSRVKFRHLRQIGELSLPGVVDDGTVSVSRGSTAVTGVLTTFETSISAGVQEHYYFKAKSNWYRIASITNDTALVLESAFAEDDVLAGTYKIVKRTHALDSSARWAGDFYFMRLYYPLSSVSLDELNILAPGRILTDHIPRRVAQVGVDSNGVPTYEIYPPPKDSEIIQYVYWTLPGELAFTTTIPPVIDAYTLKEGALVDLYRFEKVSAIKKGNVEAAAVLANEEAKQRTIWKRVIDDAIRTSRGSDDITFILDMHHGGRRRSHDQKTAHDDILYNWSRPA